MLELAPNRQPLAGKRAVVVGGGLIGASWAALFLVNRMRVTICDSDPAIENKVDDVLDTAAATLEAIGYTVSDMGRELSFESELAAAVADADFVQENVPEWVELKQRLWPRIEQAAPRHALLLSSSSAIPASIQSLGMRDPGRLVIGHPFNPPYLMPLVEVVPGPKTDRATTQRAIAFYASLHKVAIEIRKEVPGFVANRLQSAIFRECMALVRDEVVTTDELDMLVTNSLGILWATSGPFLSCHLAGGPGGFGQFAKHHGRGMAAIWKTFEEVEFEETAALLIERANAFYEERSYDDLTEIRDARVVAVLDALADVEGFGR